MISKDDLKDLNQLCIEQDIKVGDILRQEVCHEYDIKEMELLCASRKQPLPEARKMYWFTLSRFGWTIYQIEKVSNRDRRHIHTAVRDMESLFCIYHGLEGKFNRILSRTLRRVDYAIQA